MSVEQAEKEVLRNAPVGLPYELQIFEGVDALYDVALLLMVFGLCKLRPCFNVGGRGHRVVSR
ncbi:hypothetical protein D3C87_2025960 [compost metagenome]